jgi:L-asparaginase II
MSNPILVEVLRGNRVESRHSGAIAVVDSKGKALLALGDVERPVYPRSAVKALQALPLVESGAADLYGLDAEGLALTCASHSGEPGHIDAVARILRGAGLDASALRCGAHWPIHQPSAQALARGGGVAGAIHNNCSGKHAGFLCVACAIGADRAHYTDPTHPVQRMVRAAIEQLTGAPLTPDDCAVDGCSAPTWALPLVSLARGFARFGNGAGLTPDRARAAARLREACVAHPWHVAGTGRFCTTIMEQFGPRYYVKTGAEGVYCAALPEQGLGVALKCDDGAGRAAEVMMAATLLRLSRSIGEQERLEPFAQVTLRNWNGAVVGEVRPTQLLSVW